MELFIINHDIGACKTNYLRTRKELVAANKIEKVQEYNILIKQTCPLLDYNINFKL